MKIQELKGKKISSGEPQRIIALKILISDACIGDAISLVPPSPGVHSLMLGMSLTLPD